MQVKKIIRIQALYRGIKARTMYFAEMESIKVYFQLFLIYFYSKIKYPVNTLPKRKQERLYMVSLTQQNDLSKRHILTKMVVSIPGPG